MAGDVLLGLPPPPDPGRTSCARRAGRGGQGPRGRATVPALAPLDHQDLHPQDSKASGSPPLISSHSSHASKTNQYADAHIPLFVVLLGVVLIQCSGPVCHPTSTAFVELSSSSSLPSFESRSLACRGVNVYLEYPFDSGCAVSSTRSRRTCTQAPGIPSEVQEVEFFKDSTATFSTSFCLTMGPTYSFEYTSFNSGCAVSLCTLLKCVVGAFGLCLDDLVLVVGQRVWGRVRECFFPLSHRRRCSLLDPMFGVFLVVIGMLWWCVGGRFVSDWSTCFTHFLTV
jgi:hypothetical protein